MSQSWGNKCKLETTNQPRRAWQPSRTSQRGKVPRTKLFRHEALNAGRIDPAVGGLTRMPGFHSLVLTTYGQFRRPVSERKSQILPFCRNHTSVSIWRLDEWWHSTQMLQTVWELIIVPEMSNNALTSHIMFLQLTVFSFLPSSAESHSRTHPERLEVKPGMNCVTTCSNFTAVLALSIILHVCLQVLVTRPISKWWVIFHLSSTVYSIIVIEIGNPVSLDLLN